MKMIHPNLYRIDRLTDEVWGPGTCVKFFSINVLEEPVQLRFGAVLVTVFASISPPVLNREGHLLNLIGSWDFRAFTYTVSKFPVYSW